MNGWKKSKMDREKKKGLKEGREEEGMKDRWMRGRKGKKEVMNDGWGGRKELMLTGVMVVGLKCVEHFSFPVSQLCH